MGDALKGYNAVHDVCRYLINAVIARLNGRFKRGSPSQSENEIANFDFPLTGPPGTLPENLRDRALWLHLDDQAFERKIRSSKTIPQLLLKSAQLLRPRGARRFATECLRPVSVTFDPPVLPPYYEKYGEKQVAARYYRRLLRYH